MAVLRILSTYVNPELIKAVRGFASTHSDWRFETRDGIVPTLRSTSGKTVDFYAGFPRDWTTKEVTDRVGIEVDCRSGTRLDVVRRVAETVFRDPAKEIGVIVSGQDIPSRVAEILAPVFKDLAR
jgi:hypothetical protein